jgi:hypothetical protein
LDYEQYVTTVAFLDGLRQMLQMPGATLSRGIGEGANAVMFQGNTFDFQKAGFAVLGEGKVKTGFSVESLRTQVFDFSQSTVKQPFFDSGIWRLRVHVDQTVALMHSNQIVLGLAVGIAGKLTPYLAARNQQFFAPAGVFYMADLDLTANLYVGNEPVGSGKENAIYHIFISQKITSFLIT